MRAPSATRRLILVHPVHLLYNDIGQSPSTNKPNRVEQSYLDQCERRLINMLNIGTLRGFLYILLSIYLSLSVLSYCFAQEPVSKDGVIATLSAGENPGMLAVNSVTNRVYVTNSTSNSISVLDGTNHTVIKSIPVGKGPSSVAVNSETNRVYVSNADDTKITVIDGKTNEVIANIPIDKGAYGIAVDSIRNRIYVASETAKKNLCIFDGLSNTMISGGPSSLPLFSTTMSISEFSTSFILSSCAFIQK